MKPVSAERLHFSNFNVSDRTKILAEDCLDSIKHILPSSASIHAVLEKLRSSSFEAKIGIYVWQNYIFSRSRGANPVLSLESAKRKILKKVSELHDRHYGTKRRSLEKIEELECADFNFDNDVMKTAATLTEIL